MLLDGVWMEDPDYFLDQSLPGGSMFFKYKSQHFLDILTFRNLYTTFWRYFNIKKPVYHLFGGVKAFILLF